FEFLSLPASRSWMGRIEREGGAWLAADARVACLVQRQQRNVVRVRVVPYVSCGPPCQRADLPNDLPAGQAERFDPAERRARWRLLTPQTREPRVVPFERGEQRFNLVARATGLGAGLPKSRRRLLGAQVDQVEIPGDRHPITVRVGLRKVMHR